MEYITIFLVLAMVFAMFRINNSKKASKADKESHKGNNNYNPSAEGNLTHSSGSKISASEPQNEFYLGDNDVLDLKAQTSQSANCDGIIKASIETHGAIHQVTVKQYVSLENYLTDHDIEYIDNRAKGGALWIIDKYANFEAIRSELLKKGISFRIAENGGKASQHLRAWYTKDIDKPNYEHVILKWFLPNVNNNTAVTNNCQSNINRTKTYSFNGKKDTKAFVFKNVHPSQDEEEKRNFLLLIKEEEEEMEKRQTEYSCRNCMQQRAQECVGQKEICEFFQYSPKPLN